MRATDLSSQQRHQLMMAMADRRDWFKELIARMDAKGWEPSDATYLAAVKARDAIHLTVQAVHASRPREAPSPPALFFGDRGPG